MLQVQIILTVLIKTRMHTLFIFDTRSILLACYGPSALLMKPTFVSAEIFSIKRRRYVSARVGDH